MAHEQQRDFCKSVKERLPEFFNGRLVVDIGSLDINGSNQYLFENSGYIGVDLFEGRNVDIACKGHELAMPDESVDVVISTECFEHDSHYAKTIKNIYRMLKPGGLFLFSCATTGRPEHGTRRTTPEDAPFIQLLGNWADYYKNLEESDIRAVLDIDAAFEKYEFSSQHESHDLYFWGVKKGELAARNDYSFLVESGIAGKLRAELTRTVGEIEVVKAEALSLKDSLRVAEAKALGLSKENECLVNQIEQLNAKQAEVAHLTHLVSAMQGSRSWRYSAALRKVASLARPPVRFLRRIRAVATHTGGYAALVYKVINLGRDRGFLALINRIRSDLLVGCNYGDASGHQNENLIEEGVQDLVVANERVVPLLNAKPLEEKEIKLICFYLPQFHTFSENDKWWGKGFTEWTNVRPAKPQYLGHYQPHIPGELGYYNLLDSKTQMRQIELAKLYGIEGFCFYFYWFAGHRLMEQPILNYLNNESLDLPFCLCWANENWSRRWDGLDSEILIAQAHSPDDDLDFISHVSMYLKDKRYIRIDGKPLLLVYRPSLLPSAKKTVTRWRTWCRDNGVGEIYLACTQSFDSVNPSQYGFDAAIEFPPNNMNLPSATHKVNGVVENFSSSLFDWKEMVRRSRNYLNPGYKLFRGVNPSWDNTARRKNKGNILYGSNPIDYQEWLLNALNYTKKIFPSKDERMVFVNAWNEWAEGAHLEPDEKYGYAYLDATRMAQVRALSYVSDQNKSNDLAVVIHVFYYDVFVEILENLERIKDVKLNLFITVDASCYEQVERRLQETMFEYSLISVENKGRDVLPFLKAMDLVCAEGYASFLKIHTKKSKHRADGDVWRKDLYAKLMSPDVIKNVLSIFENNKKVGLIAPSGHLVDMGYYLGSNHERIEALSARMGVRLASVLNLKFAAGTMFIARCDAMMPLINLHLCDEDFESELGQVDGTLAHAIERLISVSCFSKGFEIFDTELEPIESSGRSYKFASAGVNI
jgi:lipopolysaccharide biosynthesis protein/SAM-dependent methyltransferase